MILKNFTHISKKKKTANLLNELRKFLIEAKRKTFAGDGKKSSCQLYSSTKFTFKKRYWLYQDIYYGSLNDIGQEVILYKNIPVWGMNYYGGVTQDVNKSPNEIFKFLKDALLHLPPQFPIRGPHIWTNKSFIYVNIYDGTLSNFSGREQIFYIDNLVYIKIYHGGLINSYKQWGIKI